MADPVIIQSQDVKLGDEITREGIKLRVDQEFTQCKDAKASSYKYFMNSPKGVYGLVEV